MVQGPPKILGPPRYLGPPIWGRGAGSPKYRSPKYTANGWTSPLIFVIFHLTENQMKGSFHYGYLDTCSTDRQQEGVIIWCI